jgi:hypothetical protein
MMTMEPLYFLRLLFSNLAALSHNPAAHVLNVFAAPILKILLLLHFLNSCMLLLFSILACCSCSQFLHAALILHTCMLLLFSIPACCSYSQFLHAALIRNSCIHAALILNSCCSCS